MYSALLLVVIVTNAIWFVIAVEALSHDERHDR